MVKDKVNINIPAFNLKLSYVIPIVLVLFLGFTTLKQWSSTKDLRNEKKEFLKTEKILNNIIADNDKRIESDSLIITSQLNLVDSIMDSFENERLQHKILKRRYGKIKADYYNNATIDSKWDLLTDKLDN